MADGGTGGQLDRLRKQAALESARLDNINPNGGRYHGEGTLNQLEETLSRATQATSNFLEGHWWGRNLKGNLSNWSQMAIGAAGRMADYAEAESTRTPTNPGQALGFIAGNIGKSREQYTDVATDAITDYVKINGQAIDPRITRAIVGDTLDTLATAGAGGIARKGLSILDKAVPPGTGGLMPVPVDNAGSLAIRQADEVAPSNVFQTHAGHPQALGQGRPWSQPQADAGRTIFNKEAKGKPQTSTRGEKAQHGTDYLKSDPNLYNEQYLLAKGIGESHHVGDHDFIGGIAQELGEIRGPKLLKNLQTRNIRSGNDAQQMITIPGKGSGPGARFDHVGLMHNRWYPQIDTRQQLVKAVQDGSIHSMSDDRIAKLVASTVKQQQRITIGWAKWKLDTVRQLYPETMYFKPKEMRAWLEQNPQKFAEAGGKSAPQNYGDIMNYGRTKGQDNYSNAYLREVFNVQYGGRSAAQGLEHPISAKNRQELTVTGKRKTGKH